MGSEIRDIIDTLNPPTTLVMQVAQKALAEAARRREMMLSATLDRGQGSDSSASTTPSVGVKKRIHSKQTPISESKKTPSTSTPDSKWVKVEGVCPTPVKKLQFVGTQAACPSKIFTLKTLHQTLLTKPHVKHTAAQELSRLSRALST